MGSKYDLAGILALVTGGGSGMGRAVAQALAEEGATVIVADINVDGAQETIKEMKGTNHIAFKVDVSSEKSVKELADMIKQKFDRCPSVVIHAAGVASPATLNRTSVFDITADQFGNVMDINLKGTFLIVKTFGQWMRDDQCSHGSIVNFSSVAGQTPVPILADYCSSKSGVNMITQCFGKELAAVGIRVNAVAPFFIKTPLLRHFPQAAVEAFVAGSPSKRMGLMEEVTQLCLFLASKSSSYINGQSIPITGGF